LFDWHCRGKGGNLFWAEVNLKGAVIGGQRRILAVIRDITDRKRAEAEAQQHLNELTRAWHANTLGEMASGLAHELNQPLCAILNYSNGCLRMTRRKSFSLDVVSASIEQIAAQAERAADIIKHIRSLVAKRDSHRTKLNINGVVSNAMDMVRSEADKSNVAIVSEFAHNLPAVRGNAVELEQVVLNLVRNAIEAMSDPTVTERKLTVSTSRQEDKMIQVVVSDTGRGFSSELSERIFDSFFTTKDQGLGVGLSLSRRIVGAYGGRLWAESDGVSGATFRFTIPAEGADNGR
jgi:C4-dicarboxylate-specific signal transduction histidine kinase